MKNIFLFIFPLLFPLLLAGQYKPMLSEGSTWHHYFWFEGSCNHELVVSGDTILNNTKYKKVINVGDLCNVDYYSFVRENILEKQVYCYNSYEGETLLYDFSLEVGDTMHYEEYSLILDSIVSNIPMEDWCDNNFPELYIENPKVFYFSYTEFITSYSAIWVEGIGNLTNLFFPQSSFLAGNSEMLLCHYDSDNVRDYHLVYCEEPETCNGPVLNTNELAEPIELNIVPNPCGDTFIFEVENPSIILQSVSFYDSTGKFLRKEECSSSSYDISDLPKGIIIAVIQTKSAQILAKKLIKK